MPAAEDDTPAAAIDVWVQRIEYRRHWSWCWGFEGELAAGEPARNLLEVFAAARRSLDAREDAPVSVRLDSVPGVSAPQQRLDAVIAMRTRLEELKSAVGTESAALARDLVAGRVTLADVGVLMGISTVRAAFLADPDPEAALERKRRRSRKRHHA
ncbi:MAG: hypothetical protein HOQ24_01520 [Mycobacteriaceae bacterium]|nr:hypothetical protein [Mycobacteriaceae bacterium]